MNLLMAALCPKSYSGPMFLSSCDINPLYDWAVLDSRLIFQKIDIPVFLYQITFVSFFFLYFVSVSLRPPALQVYKVQSHPCPAWELKESPNSLSTTDSLENSRPRHALRPRKLYSMEPGTWQGSSQGEKISDFREPLLSGQLQEVLSVPVFYLRPKSNQFRAQLAQITEF